MTILEETKIKNRGKTIVKKKGQLSSVEDKEELDPYDTEIKSIATKLEERLSPELVNILKRICYEVGIVGLSEKDACLLANYSYEKLIELRSREPLVDRLIDMKTLEYERGILKNISEKAKSDDKLGQWMLEIRNPHKYNRKKGAPAGGGKQEEDESLLADAIECVQGDNESTLVKKESGKGTASDVDVDDARKLTLEKFLS